VDDDVDALQMARDALSFAGATVTTASGGHEALAALDNAPFDVAIVDIGMPRMDGYELLRRIRERKSEEQGRIPIAALTAYARSTDRTRSLQSGFHLHLTKPVQPGELTAAVLALADRAGGERRSVLKPSPSK
jgi:CheY-like chemotaxis protein